jgi:hypothetical protein
MPSLLIFVDLHLAVNNIKPSTVGMGRQEWVYFTLLSELQNIAYCCLQYECGYGFT